jgi:hypothetical protein
MKIYTIWIAGRLSKIYPKLKVKLDKEKVKIYIGISSFQTMFEPCMAIFSCSKTSPEMYKPITSHT